MALNSPETRGLTPEEIEKLQRQAEHEAQLAQAAEVLDVAQAKAEKPVIRTSEVPSFDNVETRLKQPLTPEIDLADAILQQLEGKSNDEKINILLSGKYGPAETNEAMARIIKKQDSDKAT
jgi:hypothetical protein